MVPSYSLPGSIPLKNILKENSGKKRKYVSINNDDTAFQQYTGGTTESELSKANMNYWKYMCQCFTSGILDWK